MDFINTNYSDYSTYMSMANTSGLTGQLAGTKSPESTDEEMMDACKEFESYMVEQMFKQARATTKMSDDEEDGYTQYAYDLQAQQYAQMVTEQGKLGLAQYLYESMKKQDAGISPEQLRAQEEAALTTQETSGNTGAV